MNAGIRKTGIYRVIVFAVAGLLAGWFVAGAWNPLPLTSRTQIVPAPYRVAKIPGGTALRLAMVHDILHERYLPHGPAWYAQRNANARKVIESSSPDPGAFPSTKYLDAMDDLAIGLEIAGQYSESISILRKKLALVSPLPSGPATRAAFDAKAPRDSDEQIDLEDLEKRIAAQNLSPLQHQQYTTCANLGTVLIHSAMPKALGGDTEAKSKVREGLNFIERAIAINAGAHFGRETWQAIAVENMLAAVDHPDILTRFDLIGDRLDAAAGGDNFLGYPRGYFDITDRAMQPAQRVIIRSNLDRAGNDPDWAAIVNPDYSAPMPFDEPTLAIVGMWTLGGGPNPHFAVALGRIMENIGQRAIAWNAYERAVEMQERFWPDSKIGAQMVAICRDRQNGIAKIEDTANPGGWQDKMRMQHVRELAWGLEYQKRYQDFEATQISAGVPLDAELPRFILQGPPFHCVPSRAFRRRHRHS